MNGIADIKLEKQKVLHEQVREQIRNLILSGKLAPGNKLPSTVQIATVLNTHVSTVHIALTNLAKEGLLVRYNGKGTFVRQREEKLTCVGIYHGQDIWEGGSSNFERAVHVALKEELTQLGVQLQTWIDPRSDEERATPWNALVRAAENRDIQGVVSLMGEPHIRWLNKLSIPSAHLADGSIPNTVNSDFPQLAELSLRCLAKQGCRSVGLIVPNPCAVSNPDGSRNVLAEFFERFTDLASDLDLTVRNQWMRIPSAKPGIHGEWPQEHYGYEEFLKLWSQPQRPEGLVVYPDTVARGVILGLREKQVRVPADLKLVITKNESIPLLCPMPATFLVHSERAFARALIEQMQKQFRGESCEPISVPFRLVAHPAVERTHCGARRGNSPQQTTQPQEKDQS